MGPAPYRHGASPNEHIRIAAGVEQSDEPRKRLPKTLGQGVFGSGVAYAETVGGSLVHGSNRGNATAASFSLLAKGIEGETHQLARELEPLGYGTLLAVDPRLLGTRDGQAA